MEDLSKQKDVEVTRAEWASTARPLCGPTASEVVYDERGVDRSLIRWMISLSPLERLRHAESAAATVLAATHGQR